MSRTIRPHEITATQVGVAARVRLEATVERSDEGQRMFYITIRALAEDGQGHAAEVGMLTAWHAIYPDLSSILADADAPGLSILSEFDEASYDACLAVEGLLDTRTRLAPRITRSIVDDTPTSLVYVEQVAVHPAMRGHGLGLALIRALRSQLSTAGTIAVLKAIPIETPYDTWAATDEDRGAMAADAAGTAALTRYYRSDRLLGFQKPSRNSAPDLLVAAWPAFAILPQISVSAILPVDIFGEA